MPGWDEVLRFPSATSLRVQVTLAAVLRGAIRRASGNTTLWLDALDGAELRLGAASEHACRLLCETAAGLAEFNADRSIAGFYTLCGRADIPGGKRSFVLADIALQTGGCRDAYLAQWLDGACSPVVRLRYNSDGSHADVAIYHAALAARMTPAMRALLPNPIDVARLSIAGPLGPVSGDGTQALPG